MRAQHLRVCPSSDLSIPVGKMYEVIEDIRARFKEKGMFEDGSIKLCVGYGHVGDGNIHLNVVANKWDSKVEDVLEPWVYEWVCTFAQSIANLLTARTS